MKLFIALLVNVNKLRTSAGSPSLNELLYHAKYMYCFIVCIGQKSFSVYMKDVNKTKEPPNESWQAASD
jgi:hypothetical protein